MKFSSTIPKKLFFFGVLFSLAYSPVAQAQYVNFGKNRVQYQQFEWRFIQSKHFDVYYYGDKNYELAEFAAKSIEENSPSAFARNSFNCSMTSSIMQ